MLRMLDFKRCEPHFRAMRKIIEIYSKFTCPFCSRAKQLLDAKGAEYTEYDITMGGADQAGLVAYRAGEGPAAIVEELALDQVLG